MVAEIAFRLSMFLLALAIVSLLAALAGMAYAKRIEKKREGR